MALSMEQNDIPGDLFNVELDHHHQPQSRSFPFCVSIQGLVPLVQMVWSN